MTYPRPLVLPIVLLSVLAPLACSGPLDSGDGLPAFEGELPSGSQSNTTQNNRPADGNTEREGDLGSGQQGGSSNDEQAIADGLDTSDANTSNNGNTQSGGAGSTDPAQQGMAGSAMSGAGGSGQGMGQGGASDMATGGSGMGGSPVQQPVDFPGTGCGSAAFFCEDFEALEVGNAQASNGWRPEGSPSIDSEAVQGQRSLRLQPNGGQFARIVLDNFAPPTNGFYGRMFVLVDQYPTAPNYAHYVLVEATGSGSSERVRPVGGQLINEAGNLNMWGPGADGGPTGDWTNWRPESPTRDGVWECVEWQLDDATNTMNLWIDEQFQAEASTNTNPNNPGATFLLPQFNSIWFGWGVFQGGTTPGQFDVHLDDIVLSTERIGCD